MKIFLNIVATRATNRDAWLLRGLCIFLALLLWAQYERFHRPFAQYNVVAVQEDGSVVQTTHTIEMEEKATCFEKFRFFFLLSSFVVGIVIGGGMLLMILGDVLSKIKRRLFIRK